MSEKPILYSYYWSSCSWRVRTALALKGVEYICKTIDLFATDAPQYSTEYQTLNPLSQVPALIVNGNEILVESLAIIDYLEETYSAVSLLPKDPILRAKSRAIAEIITSGIQPLQNSSVLQKIEEIKDIDASNSWKIYWIDRKFRALEKIISQTNGKCCIGDDITIADICLVPQVFNAIKFGVDLNPFPIINKINTYLLTLEPFQVSHPYKQPDCPQEYKD